MGSLVGVMIILKTLVLMGPEMSLSTPLRPFISVLPLPLNSALPVALLSVRVTSIWETFSSSVTSGILVRSMTRKGRVSSRTREPPAVRRAFTPVSFPSAIQPEVVMVSSDRVMVFSATGMAVKG